MVPGGVLGDASLVVAFVEGGGPADRAGIIVGDVLLGTEGVPAAFGGAGDFSDALVRSGECVRLRMLRGGKALVVSVDLRASGRAA